MENAYIVSACRTAIGSFGGSLKDISAAKLGEIVVKEAIKRSGIILEDIDEVILGNVLGAGQGQNIARQAAIGAGLSVSIPSYVVNKVCASGLKSIALAAQSIMLGEADCIVAGGTENMSQAPYLLKQHRWGERMGDGTVEDYMVKDGLWDIFNDYHMGITAENIAEKYGITRQQQDEFAASSQVKAATAQKEGRFNKEIVPVEIPQKKKDPIVFENDEYIRAETTFEKLSGLRPAFKKDGTVTAGNASGINDGAAAVMIVSERYLKNKDLIPMAKILSSAAAGVDPALMGTGPIPASLNALKKANIPKDQLGLIEANEAFAAQSISVLKELALDSSIVNVNGGAIALGHPIGASGARILVTLLFEMHRRNIMHGLATLCIGGGMGMALIVERDSICK